MPTVWFSALTHATLQKNNGWISNVISKKHLTGFSIFETKDLRWKMARQRTRKSSKGCSCKKSGCLKNYCECYEFKIPCNTFCRCLGKRISRGNLCFSNKWIYLCKIVFFVLLAGCKNTQFIHQPKQKFWAVVKGCKKKIPSLKHEKIESMVSCLFAKAEQCILYGLPEGEIQFELIMQFNRALGIILSENP